MRLSEHARGSIRGFIATDEHGAPNGFSLAEDRPLHLVKKVTVSDKGWTFELHDAQAALVTILKVHGAFNDDGDWRTALAKMGINAADFFAQFRDGLKPTTAKSGE